MDDDGPGPQASGPGPRAPAKAQAPGPGARGPGPGVRGPGPGASWGRGLVPASGARVGGLAAPGPGTWGHQFPPRRGVGWNLAVASLAQGCGFMVFHGRGVRTGGYERAAVSPFYCLDFPFLALRGRGDTATGLQRPGDISPWPRQNLKSHIRAWRPPLGTITPPVLCTPQH